MLNYLGHPRTYYEDIEAVLLTEYPEIDMFLPGTKVEKSSFRFYYRKKFIAYLNVHSGYFDVMTRYTAEGIKSIDENIYKMSDYARDVWKKRYPCGTGAWIHYHVDSQISRDEALIFLRFKVDSIVKNPTKNKSIRKKRST